MENKYHTVGTVPKSNRQIVETGRIDTPNTQIHDCLLCWLGTDTSIKSGRVRLVYKGIAIVIIWNLSYNDPQSD